MVCGGLALAGDNLTLQHAIRLVNLDVNEFERPLQLVMSSADELEVSLTASTFSDIHGRRAVTEQIDPPGSPENPRIGTPHSGEDARIGVPAGWTPYLYDASADTAGGPPPTIAKG